MRKLFRFVSHLGKWSMLDVFIVAILVLTIRSKGVANIRVQDGLFLFFSSVMLTQIAAVWTDRIAAHKVEEKSESCERSCGVRAGAHNGVH